MRLLCSVLYMLTRELSFWFFIGIVMMVLVLQMYATTMYWFLREEQMGNRPVWSVQQVIWDLPC